MSRQITFDWQTGEEDFVREYLHHSSFEFDEPRSDGERILALIGLRTLAALIVMIVASGSASLSPQQMDRLAIERELISVLSLDEAAWRAKDRDGHAALIDPRVDREWLGEWRDNWGTSSESGRMYDLTLGTTRRVSDELVQAEVYVTLPRANWWQSVSSRESRFYREVDGLWMRTLPPASYWGAPMTLQSRYFTYHYYAPDAESVRASVDRLDSAYAGLYSTLGLGPVPEQERIVITVKPALVRSRGWGDGNIELTSPQLTQIPRDATDAQYLADRIYRRVTSLTLREKVPYGASHRWAFMISVLRGWLNSELLGQPPSWRAESDKVFRAHTEHLFPLEMDDLDEYFVGGVPGRNTVLWRYAAATTLLDYAVAAEGRDVLPELVVGFSEYRTWAGLIEGVFDNSEEEFTAGWNEYLRTEYGF